MRSFPIGLLAATIPVQAAATMAAYSMSAAAPAIAEDLAIDGALIGYYASVVYGFGMLSALGSPGAIHRWGAVRVSQACVVTAMLGVLVAGLGGSVAAIALSAVVIGLGYGMPAPSSSHLLVRHTPERVRNIVFSIRQTGVPLGGILAGLAVPPLLLAFGWRVTLLLEALPCAVLILALQVPRKRYDDDRDVAWRIDLASALRPLALLRHARPVRCLSIAAFVYTGAQLSFGSFMVVYLTSRLDFSLLFAGQILAAFQIAGVVSRPIWGWIADSWISARMLLVLQGIAMAGAAFAFAGFTSSTPIPPIILAALVAGATASGYTGLAFAEYARLGGEGKVAEATGVGTFAMFSGVMVIPSLFSLTVVTVGSYMPGFVGMGVLALVGACVLMLRNGSSLPGVSEDHAAP